MALLAGKNYDPAAIVNKSTAATLAMTALDTVNLRNTFTAPANGSVLVRLRGMVTGGGNAPQILLGVLDGATIRGRTSPICGRNGTSSVGKLTYESTFIVTGLTPGNSYTWDAAYGVETAVASTNLKYGGPDDTVTNNAAGGFQFEVWDTPNLLGAILYDPATAVQKATSALTVMTAIDTTNLRLTFTAPTSGNVYVTMIGATEGAATIPQLLFGVLDGVTVRARSAPIGGVCDVASSPVAADRAVFRSDAIVTGLTGGNSYTWDAAFAVDVLIAATNLNYGGPDNATADDAWGGFVYMIWAA